MKILVVSDSHGNCDYIHCAIERERPDHLIHLGDHTADAQRLKREYPMMPVLSVRGNCDWTDIITPEAAEAVYDNIRVFAVHGHHYGVKNGLLRVFMAAKEKAARIVLFGHTHCAFCEERDGIWLLNPGSCGHGARISYGLIDTGKAEPECSIRFFDEREVLL